MPTLTETALSSVSQDLLERRGIYAMSVPSGMGTTRIIADLARDSGAQIRVADASCAKHGSLETVVAAAAPASSARQLRLRLGDGALDARRLRIAPADMDDRLAEAFSMWVHRRPDTAGPVLLVIDSVHRLSSTRSVDGLIDALIKARGDLPISFLLLGNETFVLPESPALRVVPNAAQRARIGWTRTRFNGFVTIHAHEIGDPDVAIMLANLDADPGYRPIACQAMQQLRFNADYHNLMRLIEFGEEVGGPDALTQHEIARNFDLPFVHLRCSATSNLMPASAMNGSVGA